MHDMHRRYKKDTFTPELPLVPQQKFLGVFVPDALRDVPGQPVRWINQRQ